LPREKTKIEIKLDKNNTNKGTWENKIYDMQNRNDQSS